jgi:hypothetical protein
MSPGISVQREHVEERTSCSELDPVVAVTNVGIVFLVGKLVDRPEPERLRQEVRCSNGLCVAHTEREPADVDDFVRRVSASAHPCTEPLGHHGLVRCATIGLYFSYTATYDNAGTDPLLR